MDHSGMAIKPLGKLKNKYREAIGECVRLRDPKILKWPEFKTLTGIEILSIPAIPINVLNSVSVIIPV